MVKKYKKKFNVREEVLSNLLKFDIGYVIDILKNTSEKISNNILEILLDELRMEHNEEKCEKIKDILKLKVDNNSIKEDLKCSLNIELCDEFDSADEYIKKFDKETLDFDKQNKYLDLLLDRINKLEENSKKQYEQLNIN